MKIENSIYAKNIKVWSNWLRKNHAIRKECWIIFPKKHTGISSITYEEAIEEALCYGWIDSNIQNIDEKNYGRRFSPRKINSKWSGVNKKRIQKLVKEGRITKVELRKFNIQGVKDDYGRTPKQRKIDLIVPTYFLKELLRNERAYNYFRNLAPSYRRNYLLWIKSAKTKDTREKRIIEAILLLSKNQKLGMK
jgi:uncharacterized protein YdeI (YjbR/CyaY-like superfamily)